MQEITRLLDKQGILYFDRKLHWENADIRAYLPELELYGNQPGVRLYGIELYGKTDTKKYANYVLIDHHNENQGRIASILQVAEVLGVVTNFWLLQTIPVISRVCRLWGPLPKRLRISVIVIELLRE